MSENAVFQVTPRGDREIVMTRVFDAPRELVWAAFTDPEHLKHWWGRGNPMTIEIDVRVGGRYRFVEHSPEGDEAFRGEILELVPNEKVVQTFEWEGLPGHIATDTMVLTEQDGKTLVTTTSMFTSQEDRDGMIASGMETGARQSYEALEAYLAKL
ncbi:MAG: SRPBCC family protein [Hamadaea sp.]|uniref:SRPBCC family protein n=1 Tax=Hamadaea sp. NPDC050747 TaxID=3155789 RepID=UPI00181DEFC3|nr:SRPBCC family protein [Hamadaea sp.]NUR50144.1 SRPBCC family protein [Hamadaea sp.]NUT07360.1 SRPBCC family protein [Hamadaea sp.]